MSKIKPFPSRPQSFGITFLIIISMLVFTFFYMDLQNYLPDDLSMLIYYLVALGLPVILLHFKKKKEEEKYKPSLSFGNVQTILLISLVGLGLLFGISSPISSSLPMSDWIKDAFMQLANHRGWVSFLMLAVAAPILEEYIFRGIILDGLLKRYSVWSSIFLSSFLFGLVHLNPWQFISAMIIGIFSGWVYYRSRNLFYPILIHFVNNATAFVFMQILSPEEYLESNLIESYGGFSNAIILISTSLLLALAGIWALNQSFNKPVNWHSSPIVNSAEQ